MKASNKYDIAIIGAGIVGLATAYHLIVDRPNLNIIILERESKPGQHQSGNNSGVIHSGIYYKPGSSKALNCSKGYQLLLDFCDHNKIPYNICGKIIAAIDPAELEQLELLRQRGLKNGLSGIRYLTTNEVKEKEPNLQCIKALWVPQTGVISFPKVVETLTTKLTSKGVVIQYNYRVKTLEHTENQVNIHTNSNTFAATRVVNCAGTNCDQLAGFPKEIRIIPFRGEYWNIKPKKAELIRHLIYPVPNPDLPFLGIHFTRRIDNTVDIGPNAVFAFSKDGYRIRDISWRHMLRVMRFSGFWKLLSRYAGIGLTELRRSGSKAQFLKEARRYVPSLSIDDLEPGGAGVRAQAVSNQGKLLDDFHIIKEGHAIHVLNAPSPAATSCFAIGQEISLMVSL